jgi:hypothetical protein
LSVKYHLLFELWILDKELMKNWVCVAVINKSRRIQ